VELVGATVPLSTPGHPVIYERRLLFGLIDADAHRIGVAMKVASLTRNR
jgi:hypothetical protein